MLLSNAPTKVTVPFANSGTKNTIPIASQIGITAGAASYTDGFPPLTFTPLNAGGVPPAGADFNGILNAISQAVRWQMAGGTYQYDSAFSTAVSGYPKGALLTKTTYTGLWLNTTDANAANPDTGGAGWVDLGLGRLLGVQVITASGTYTPGVYNGVAATRARVVMIGGGGAGGGAPATGAGAASVGTGGNMGGYVIFLMLSNLIATAVTVGAAGAGISGTTGGTGGNTVFGTIATAFGGTGGAAQGPTAGPNIFSNQANNTAGTPSGTGVVPILSIPGWIASASAFILAATTSFSGKGADSPLGTGGGGQGNGLGGTGSGYGSGGGGSANAASLGARLGGNGTPGVIIVEEYA